MSGGAFTGKVQYFKGLDCKKLSDEITNSLDADLMFFSHEYNHAEAPSDPYGCRRQNVTYTLDDDDNDDDKGQVETLHFKLACVSN